MRLIFASIMLCFLLATLGCSNSDNMPPLLTDTGNPKPDASSDASTDAALMPEADAAGFDSNPSLDDAGFDAYTTPPDTGDNDAGVVVDAQPDAAQPNLYEPCFPCIDGGDDDAGTNQPCGCQNTLYCVSPSGSGGDICTKPCSVSTDCPGSAMCTPIGMCKPL